MRIKRLCILADRERDTDVPPAACRACSGRGKASGHLIRFIAQFVGLALVVVGLTDVYLTVLYARSGVGFISRLLIPAVWRFFRAAGSLIPRTSWADLWLAFCGPTMIVLLVGVWVWM